MGDRVKWKVKGRVKARALPSTRRAKHACA